VTLNYATWCSLTKLAKETHNNKAFIFYTTEKTKKESKEDSYCLLFIS
jgi:hypothetical protein